ncbi:tyrosine-type recombinase/integrase, partial [Salmonella enterica]|uniref:tyrosine-type recombinase/integrase n=1 Tax=Salmonella enterica TaxID=28901 RepID=UPI00398C56E8
MGELEIAPHHRMLRQAWGYTRGNKEIDTRLIQDYLAHRNIQHTLRYTASNAGRCHGTCLKKRLDYPYVMIKKVNSTSPIHHHPHFTHATQANTNPTSLFFSHF